MVCPLARSICIHRVFIGLRLIRNEAQALHHFQRILLLFSFLEMKRKYTHVQGHHSNWEAELKSIPIVVEVAIRMIALVPLETLYY